MREGKRKMVKEERRCEREKERRVGEEVNEEERFTGLVKRKRDAGR